MTTSQMQPSCWAEDGGKLGARGRGGQRGSEGSDQGQDCIKSMGTSVALERAWS